MSEDIDMESFLFTKAGIIIAMVTGSISFLSSMIIISIVLRSMSGIKTTYHRIILGLSSADCLTSLMIALTTIPMPKDVIYPFEMPSYGNIATCEAQGLIYMMGNGLGLCMNGILNIYYLCTLRYNMPEKTFRCYLEIPLFIVSLVTSITLPSTTLLNQELLNPSPTYPFCVPKTYPLGCTKADNPECRGGGGRGVFAPLFYSTITLGFLTLMITMSLIVHSFYRNALSLRKALKDKPSQEIDAKYEAVKRAQETSSIVGRQALMYIAAFFITWIFGFVSYLWEESGNDNTEFLYFLTMIFQPLQGFFNLIIFAYHKVYTVLRSDEDLTIAEVLAIVFLHPDEIDDSVQLSNLDLLLEEIDKSDVLSGAGHDIQLNSGNASESDESSDFVHNETLQSTGEDRIQTSKFFRGRRKAPAHSRFHRKGKMTYVANERKKGPNDLSVTSKETNNDGISFTSVTIKKATKEAFNDDDSTNLSYRDTRSGLSKFSGFSNILGFQSSATDNP